MNHPLPPDTAERPLAPGQRLPEARRKELSPEVVEEIRSLATKYPDKLAATLPALYATQREFGFLSLSAMREVARVLEIPEGHVFGVATFYTMFRKGPVGKFHLQVCTNLSCALRGAADVLRSLCDKTGVEPGGAPSTDGMWSVEEVECLASCGSGPCLQVNHNIYEEFVDEGSLDRLLKACREGQIPAWGEE